MKGRVPNIRLKTFYNVDVMYDLIRSTINNIQLLPVTVRIPFPIANL